PHGRLRSSLLRKSVEKGLS
ncbi:hypothetical protein A5847_002642, partial [Enterococcus faecium]